MVKKTKTWKILEKDAWWPEKTDGILKLLFARDGKTASSTESHAVLGICGLGLLALSTLCKSKVRTLAELGQVMGAMMYCCKELLLLTDSEHKFTEGTFTTSADGWRMSSVRCWRESPSCQQLHLFL